MCTYIKFYLRYFDLHKIFYLEMLIDMYMDKRKTSYPFGIWSEEEK
jgi:hypothetical protein